MLEKKKEAKTNSCLLETFLPSAKGRRFFPVFEPATSAKAGLINYVPTAEFSQ
jgi:hypothetical protein